MSLSIAVVGANGLVGQTFLNLIKTESFIIENLQLFGSENSAGNIIDFNGKHIAIKKIYNGCFDCCDFIFLFCPKKVSKICIDLAMSSKGIVIDNSSLLRMNENIPLIIPEINGCFAKGNKIISNPNCTTAICALPLYAISRHFKLQSVNFCTYQAVSGSGKMGIDELERCNNNGENRLYAHDISKTCIPKIGCTEEYGYTTEEWKMINETKKILNDYNLNVSATCVRVPIKNCHAVSIYLKLKNDFSISKIKEVLSNQVGVKVLDDTEENLYPVATVATGSKEVFVGRIRRCLQDKNALLMYVLSDNLLRGAAYNALLIMKYLIQNDK